MSALTPVFLNAEFGLLWSVRQLLRGIAIGIGITSGMLALALFWSADALGQALEALRQRTRIPRPSRVTNQLATSPRGYKERLS